MALAMKIVKSPAGEISKNGCWVAISSEYLYTADTLFKLVIILITEWENDRHLCG